MLSSYCIRWGLEYRSNWRDLNRDKACNLMPQTSQLHGPRITQNQDCWAVFSHLLFQNTILQKAHQHPQYSGTVGFSSTHEAIRSELVITLLPVHGDMLSCFLHRMIIAINQCQVAAAQWRIVPAGSRLVVVPGVWYHTACASPFLTDVCYNNNNSLFSENCRLVHMLHTRKSDVNIVYKCNRRDGCQTNRKFIIAGRHIE